MKTLTIDASTFQDKFLNYMNEVYPNFIFKLKEFPSDNNDDQSKIILDILSKEYDYKNYFYLGTMSHSKPNIKIDLENLSDKTDFIYLFKIFPKSYDYLCNMYDEVNKNNLQPEERE